MEQNLSAAPAEIDIIATDDASDVFQEVSSNFTDMSSNVSEASDAKWIQVAATEAAAGAMGLFDAVCDANPIMLVVLAVTALAAGKKALVMLYHLHCCLVIK